MMFSYSMAFKSQESMYFRLIRLVHVLVYNIYIIFDYLR